MAFIVSIIITLQENQAQSTSAVPLPSTGTTEYADRLPNGDAKAIILTKCQSCHTLERIVISQRSRDEWTDVLDLMISYAAPLTPEEKPKVLDYLVQSFGPISSNTVTSAPSSQANIPAMAGLTVDPDRAQFSAVPDSFGLPSGVQMALIGGDPSKGGLFSMLLRIPAGQSIAPRQLVQQENIVCLRGNLQVGQGGNVDDKRLELLSPGAVIHIPARMQYFAIAKDSTIILVFGEGPFALSK